MQRLKIVFGSVLIAALLFAGLFLFRGQESAQPDQHRLVKPSQMTFSQGNQFSENFNAKPESADVSESKATAKTPPPLPEKEIASWNALEDILKSKNDNDPRLDNELAHLSAEFHRALFAKYSNLKPEDRNERGTLVFLVARDLKSPADLEFLKSVYEESPCLNMENCAAGSMDDPQEAGGQQTSLNYPQLAGLYQLDAQLSKRPELLKDPQFRAGIYALLKTAENFPAPQVHEKAQQIREKYGL